MVYQGRLGIMVRRSLPSALLCYQHWTVDQKLLEPFARGLVQSV